MIFGKRLYTDQIAATILRIQAHAGEMAKLSAAESAMSEKR